MDTISTSKNLGFRVCGMRVYQSNLKTYIVKDKPWGMSVKDNDMEGALKLFIENGRWLRYEVAEAFLPKLKNILDWFEHQTDYR